jgi:multidrug resistance efflux pump
MNNQEAAEEQRARVAQEQRFNDRLDEAEASIAHLRHCARLQDSATAAVLERAERAEAELAALREDAERYRWLRDGEIVCRNNFPAAKDKAGNTLWFEELDAAIDNCKGGA